jgi:hypothetical protein
MTDVDLVEPRLKSVEVRVQDLDRRMTRVSARLDRMLDIAVAPAFLLPLLSMLIGMLISGARDETLRRDAMAILAYGFVPFVTFILGWVLGRWRRSRRWEDRAPSG